MNIINFPATDVVAKYIILDLETRDDAQLYHRYRTRDPRPAPCRWPFRRVVSASVMAVTVQDGIWEVDAFQSWAGPDDRKVVEELFSWMIERNSHRLCTYGGASEDLGVLKAAAMEFGIRLPKQLRHLERDGGGWLHLDLALTLKAGSGQFVHQSELAARLNLPSKMAGSAGQVPHLATEGRFEAVCWISECDVLLTSMLLARHLASLGQIISATAAEYVTMRFVRERREFACYHRELGNYLSRADRQMLDDQRRWLEAC
jgi:hypothetical protein